MIQCPYCGRDMKKGFIEADGRNTVLWVEENRKRSFASKMNVSDCIILENETFFRKARVASNYCDNCNKIIIDVKSKYIPKK